MQYRYAIQICNTDSQYRYAIKICNADMQQRYAIRICNKDMQYRYAIQICNTDNKIEAVRGSDATVCSRYAIKNLPCPISPPLLRYAMIVQ